MTRLLLRLPPLALAVLLVSAPAAAQDSVARPASTSVPEPGFDLAAAIAEGPPMTADQAADRAAAASPTMERARALSRAAEAAVSQTRAAMLPRLELNARYAHVDGFPDGQISLGADPAALAASRQAAMRVTDPVAQQLWLGTIDSQSEGGVTFEIPRDQLSFSARLTWPVSDLFFAMLPALEAAEAGGRAREHQVAAMEAAVRFRARETYYQLARARGGLAVAEQAARQAEAQRAQIEAAVTAGFLTRADQLGAEARVASTERAIASARAGAEVTDAALRAMMDAGDGAPHGIVEPLLGAGDDELESIEPLTARALEQRAELASLRAARDARRAAGRASDASGYPHLALYAGADLAAPNRYVIPPSSELTPSWELGALLSWSPNDTLGAVHRGEQLSAEAEEIEAQIAELERGVRLEVRQAHVQVRTARAALRSARTAVEAAEAAYASRLAQLEAGHATVAELFASEAQLNGARLAELDAAVDHRLAGARLARAAGDPR